MDDTSVAEDWEQIQALFPTRNAVTAKSWTFGFSGRLLRLRVACLMQTQAAGQLALILDQRSAARVRALRIFASVSLEQVIAAFRISIVVNVSLPILLLTVANLLFPGSAGRVFLFASAVGQTVALIQMGILFVTLIWLLDILIHALACLNQARDIRYLIDLIAAEYPNSSTNPHPKTLS